ncbi:MAG: aminotransferase class III-fold pyridoxal phosphate-dependent enzyme, partial [Victivallales bacterium]|nr:aminotransferase class III-fold pyridoxal phosphate-dependent enzyme [Victivallales bacterium]
LYSYMNFDIVPDVVSTAKGLGGGLPLGAAMLAEKVQGVLGFGDHGSTFGGNPICCAGAISILSRLTDEFLADVAQKGRFVFDTLGKAEGVEAMSGLGLMIGIKPVKAAGDVVKACMENGVLCLTAKDKVRLLPPLNIPMDVLEKAVGVIRDALK